MSLFGLIRQDIKKEKTEIKLMEEKSDKINRATAELKTGQQRN
jgi:hypothetical protein